MRNFCDILYKLLRKMENVPVIRTFVSLQNIEPTVARLLFNIILQEGGVSTFIGEGVSKSVRYFVRDGHLYLGHELGTNICMGKLSPITPLDWIESKHYPVIYEITSCEL